MLSSDERLSYSICYIKFDLFCLRRSCYSGVTSRGGATQMQANLIKLDLSICIDNQDHKLDVMHDTKTKAAAANVLHRLIV